LEFDPTGFEDLAWWIEQDRKKALKIVKLIEAIQRDPFEGIGQPESLKHDRRLEDSPAPPGKGTSLHRRYGGCLYGCG
jgi:Txe/YoeB family toxin of Txe-Axe toxin-antitoxin module